ncbi:MAG: NAD(P)-dependent oxidoreductase [Rhizobacter sp.]|nr:NAD(P)-dependent oxidoreductase [Rhizobacter sp.]
MTAAARTVGLLGLGIMGSAMGRNLVEAGFRVVGFDPVAERREALVDAGGVAVMSPREVAEQADVMLSVLPSVAALDAVVAGADGILSSAKRGQVLIESSTLPIEAKQRVAAIDPGALRLLDCPISGTGAQALTRDLSVYASGDAATLADCADVFAGFARSHHNVGEFGNGSKMKFVANLLVAIHNVSTAEAFVLGMKAGLDPADIYRVIGDGVGASRIFEVRGPLMVAADYDTATMKVETWQKDMQIIAEFAARLACPTPLLAASAALYTAAMAQGRGAQDTAAVCAVMEEMARHRRVDVSADPPR